MPRYDLQYVWTNGYLERRERTLKYRFSSHFHPFVDELKERLIRGSVRGLQAVDTEYRTPARLTRAAGASSPAGAAVPLAAGETIGLADGTVVTLADRTEVRLSGSKLVNPATGQTVTVRPSNQVTLPTGTFAQRENGAAVTLTGDALATLPDGKPRPAMYAEIFSATQYNPNPALVPDSDASPHPVKDLDFTIGGAYAVYNWELFFHVPLTIAVHLSKNGRFEEAQAWLHYIFDPTDDSGGSTPERFWKVKPFQTTDVRSIEEILINLSTGVDSRLKQQTIESINEWKDKPFQPYVVARYRQSAYMYKTVMAYLDNLIAWGDMLFRQDTGESINEATQLYVMAANILGPRPQPVPKKGSLQPQTYANLRGALDAFGNTLRELETAIPFDLAPTPTPATDSEEPGRLNALGRALYFCLPRNDKLMGYWDTVANRLFKIHNSLNIQGVFRQLPLFEPPIDPALLARAAAAGVDVAAVISGVNQPLPLVRFAVLVQKAAEICQEVKSLGNNLLSAMEKEDNEALAALRARHERAVLGMVEKIKYAQWQEAIKAREGLETSFDNAVARYKYYERLLGREATQLQVPPLNPLDLDALERKNLQSNEPPQEPREVQIDIAQDIGGASGITSGKQLSSHEKRELEALEQARNAQLVAAHLDILASGLGLIPQFNAAAKPLGVGAMIGFGGVQLSRMASMLASFTRTIGDENTYQANKAARIGSYARREQEWAFQSNLATREINQIYKQLRAAQIREAIALGEYRNHQQQMRQAEEIEYFLTGNVEGGQPQAGWKKKEVNAAYYAWMKREVKGLYAQCFQFAFDIARKAERVLQHELGNPDVRFLEFGYLSGRDGLLAGEKLYLDVKRMEMAYHDLNQREYELTKHVSLRQLDPLALLTLKATGSCEVTLPEWLFDLDAPGHYMRRIKNVSLSIPSVAGPYTSVNCTLTHLRSSLRKSLLLSEAEYARRDSEDDRFVDYFGSVQSIVTSSGNNDSGLFETNLRDERFLPFENSGVVSTWRLELPSDFHQFDYDTISDIILHMRYTARQGGDQLRSKAVEHINTLVGAADTSDLVLLLSLKNDFPDNWHRFVTGDTPFTAKVTRNYFPYITTGRSITINEVQLYSIYDKKLEDTTPTGIDPTALTTSLAGEQEFELSLPEEGVLTRPVAAPVFVLIRYSIAAP